MIKTRWLAVLWLAIVLAAKQDHKPNEWLDFMNGKQMHSGNHLSTIPVKRTTLHPRTYIRTRYIKSPNEKSSAFVNAQMNFNTSRPTIHLDNFVQIVDIVCKQTSLYLSFVSTREALAAFTEWSSHPDLIVLVGHERQCNGNQVGTFSALRLYLNGNRLQIETSASLKRSDVVSNWNLVVDHWDIKLHKRSMMGDFKFGARKQMDKLKQSSKELMTDVSNVINPNLNLHHDNQFSFNTNFNTTSNNTISSSITLFSFFEYSAYCIDCYTTGNATIRMELSGRLMEIKTYKMSINGELFSNMNLRIMKGFWSEVPFLGANLFKLPLFPINIPGVIILSPEFNVNVNVRAEYWGNGETTIGMDFRIPLNVTIVSDGTNSPTFTSQGVPVANAHPIGDYRLGIFANIGTFLMIFSCAIRSIHRLGR